MALQHDEKQDTEANVQIAAGRFILGTTVKQQKLFINLRDKISKKLFKSSFTPSDLQTGGFNEEHASKLETIGNFIQSAQVGQGGLKLSITIPKEGDNQQPGGGIQGIVNTARSYAQVVIVREDTFLGKSKYTLQLDEVARDKSDINTDSIDDIKDDMNYMREQIVTLTADLSLARQHQMPKGSVIRWFGAKRNVPKFWQIYYEDDNKGDTTDDEAGNENPDVFTYKSDFDENGIIFAIGSLYGVNEWRNPSETGLVEIRTGARMGRVSKPKDYLINRDPEIVCYVNGTENNWFSVNFKDISVRPTNYTLRHEASPSNEGHLRNWQLQGSNDGDGDVWDVLIDHNNDDALKNPDDTFTWTIPNITRFYKYIRLKMTGQTSSGRWYLCCSGFEIYGEIRKEDEDGGATKKMHSLIKIV